MLVAISKIWETKAERFPSFSRVGLVEGVHFSPFYSPKERFENNGPTFPNG